MVLFSPLARWLLLVLLLSAGFSGHTNPITPLLRPAEAARLRTQLQQPLPDTARVRLLLQLATDQFGRHDEYGTSLDSVAAYAQQAQTLSARARFVPGQIGSLYVRGRLGTDAADTLGRALLRQGIALSQRQRLPVLQAYGWFYLANTYPGTAPAQARKLVLFGRAQALFQRAGARLQAAYVLKCIADVHLVQGNLPLAIEELQRVLTLYRAAGHRELHYTYDLLVAAHRKAGNYQEALRYSFATLKSAQATHDTASIGLFYSRMGGVFVELGQPKQALTYYRKGLANTQVRDDKYQTVAAAGSIVQILIAQGQAQEALTFFTRTTQHAAAANPSLHAISLAECYAALKRYALAEQHYLQAVRYEEEGDYSFHLTWAYESVGRFYLRTKQYDKARRYLQQALQHHENKGFVLGQANQHLRLFTVDSAQGRFVAAIAHYQRYKRLTDSVFSEAKNKQLAALQVQHDTRRKEQDIALLTKQALVQQARLRQREWQRNALLLGAGGLVLLLGLGVNRYRLKQRVNRLLHAQQRQISQKNAALEAVVGDKQRLLEEKEALLEEKGWMLKEIHHRVKNNLQVISSLLSTQVDFLREPAALAALRESQNRVQAMALIHQKLYQSDNLALVDMQEYIEDITAHLLESFDCRGAVRAQLHVAPARLDVALATPLGLILNEGITNALKHAFPTGQPGTLTVALRPLGEGQRFELLIADDGVGLPPGLERRRHESLGLTMIEGLSKQIGGALHLTQAGGVQLTLQFQAARKALRPETMPA